MRILLERVCCWPLSWVGRFGVTTLGRLLIYDNSVNDLVTRFNPGTLEVGDQIWLDGTSGT